MMTILWFIRANQKGKGFNELSEWQEDWFHVVMLGFATFFLDIASIFTIGSIVYISNKYFN